MKDLKLKIEHIDKPWGYEEIIENNPKYTVKLLFMRSNHQCSYQYHKQKMETIFVINGSVLIIFEDGELNLKRGEFISINPFEKHRMRALNGDCTYLECSTSELDDVVRIQDDYNRG